MAKIVTGSIHGKGHRVYNGRKLYWVKLNNKDGDKFFGFGKVNPKGEVGDKVKFKYTSKKDNSGVLRHNYEPKTFKKIGKGTKPEAGSGGKGNYNKGGGWKPNHAQACSIARAGSFNTAIAFVEQAIAAGIQIVPKTGKAEVKLDLYMDIVQKFADEFAIQILEAGIVGEKAVKDFLTTLTDEEEADEDDEDEDLDDDEADDDESDDEDDEDDEEDEEDDEEDDDDYEDEEEDE